MVAPWRPFARVEAEQATSAQDHDKEVDQAASQDEHEDDHGWGGLAGFLNDCSEVQPERDCAVNDGSHYGPWLTDHDHRTCEQRGQSEKKSQ